MTTPFQPPLCIGLPVAPPLLSIVNNDTRVLLALAEVAGEDTSTAPLRIARRRKIMALAQVSSAQLSTSLKRLRAAQLVSGRKGEATIHPSVMWKGHTANSVQFALEND